MNSNSKRKHILLAVSNIVKNYGAEKLTLEAVAKEAGISKGGLLHHFPNKQALVNAMVEEATNIFISDINSRAANATIGDGKWIRAYIEASLDDVEKWNGINTALITSLFTNPTSLAQLQKEYAVWQENIENDGSDPVRTTIVRLAIDGLWFSELFGLGNLNKELREKVTRYLIDMASKEKLS